MKLESNYNQDFKDFKEQDDVTVINVPGGVLVGFDDNEDEDFDEDCDSCVIGDENT